MCTSGALHYHCSVQQMPAANTALQYLQAAAQLERPHAWPRHQDLKEGSKVDKAMHRLAVQLRGRKRPRGKDSKSKDSAKAAAPPSMPTAAEVLASDQPHLWQAVVRSGTWPSMQVWLPHGLMLWQH